MASTLLDLYKLASEDDRSNAGYTAAELAGLGAAGFGGYQAYKNFTLPAKNKKEIKKLKEQKDISKKMLKVYETGLPILQKGEKAYNLRAKGNKMDKAAGKSALAAAQGNAIKKMQSKGTKLGLKEIELPRPLNVANLKIMMNEHKEKVADLHNKGKQLLKEIKASKPKAIAYSALAALGLATAGGAAYYKNKQNS